MRSDYDKWFVSKDGSMTAIKCKRERLSDHLTDVFGAIRASKILPQFRRANFSEHCKLELDSLED